MFEEIGLTFTFLALPCTKLRCFYQAIPLLYGQLSS